jgi:hypothetical protein
MDRDIPIKGWDEVKEEYRRRWQARPGDDTCGWKDVEPSCRYSYEMADDPRYYGRSRGDTEPELRAGSPEWAGRYGHPCHGSGRWWERIRAGVRDAWESVAGRRS